MTSGVATGFRSALGSHQVWDAASLRARDTWRRRIPYQVLDEFSRFCTETPGLDVETFQLVAARLPNLVAFATHVRSNLLNGDGLVHVVGLLTSPLSAAERRLFYFALGCVLGDPITHHGKLYEVSDRDGSCTTQAIPVSQTRPGTGFHTDSSRIDCIPDFAGLMCEQPSLTGGESLVSNALRAYADLCRHRPDVIPDLQRSFVRDFVTPGVPKTREGLLNNRFPVFAKSRRQEGLLFRYMRYWIEEGQEKAGDPLSASALAALDALDASLKRESVRFSLEKGDMIWINNRTLAHTRTDYTDIPGHPRRLQRMWVRV